MKRLLILLSGIVYFITNACSQVNVNDGLKQITSDLMKEYIYFLASDEMKGRKTPSVELDSAASYIATQLKKTGLLPVNKKYFQQIYLCSQDLNLKETELKISKDGQSKTFVIKTDYIPFDNTANDEVNAEIVFAGYGITAPEYNYDDYKNIDVKGKIVLVLKHEPGEKDSKSIFNGTADTKYASLNEKVHNAIQHGAKGILLFTDPLNHFFYKPQGFPWPAFYHINSNTIPPALCENNKRIPFIQIGEDVINYLFGSVDEVKKMQKACDSTLKSQSFQLKNTICKMKTSLIIHDKSSNNVVGFIEGSDPVLKNEYIIIGGHYDHVGFKTNHKTGEDYIMNGADDNASGTAAIMAVAKAFQNMKTKPKRSILFIALTAEEIGLFGSLGYTKNPLFPIEKTVAMINIDMIGRNGKDSVEFYCKPYSPDLHQINEEENSKIGLKLLYPVDNENLFFRSDHIHFYNKNIPVIEFTSGLHKDYHTVYDNPDRIDFEKTAKITQLIFLTAWRIANENKYYKIIKTNN